MQLEPVRQAIEAADPDGTYRRLIESHTLECTGFIGGREKGIRDELLDQGYKAVYQIMEFPCRQDRDSGVMTLHLPDFIILGKTDKKTGKVYTVTAKDGQRLPLWDPHGTVKDREARKYDGFYSRFGSKFEITFFVNNATSTQQRLRLQNARIADWIVTAPNSDDRDMQRIEAVREIVRRELGKLALKEDGHGSMTELALIESLKDARRQREEFKHLQAKTPKAATKIKATVSAR